MSEISGPHPTTEILDFVKKTTKKMRLEVFRSNFFQKRKFREFELMLGRIKHFVIAGDVSDPLEQFYNTFGKNL